jgi:hypothetical protein
MSTSNFKFRLVCHLNNTYLLLFFINLYTKDKREFVKSYCFHMIILTSRHSHLIVELVAAHFPHLMDSLSTMKWELSFTHRGNRHDTICFPCHFAHTHVLHLCFSYAFFAFASSSSYRSMPVTSFLI